MIENVLCFICVQLFVIQSMDWLISFLESTESLRLQTHFYLIWTIVVKTIKIICFVSPHPAPPTLSPSHSHPPPRIKLAFLWW